MSDELIRRQDALEALGEEPPVWYDGEDEIAERNQWRRDVNAIKAVPAAYPEPHWIPCSEKNPPEEAKRYWICTDCGYQCQCRWTNVNYFWDGLTTNWKWHMMDIPQYSKVVAWMPLPEPWKDGV